MQLKNARELVAFLTTWISDSDPAEDESSVRKFVESAPADRVRLVLSQLQELADSEDFLIEELGSESNRWFGEPEEARSWLRTLARHFALQIEGGNATAASGTFVKDSNGTPLTEGDSVIVIKDLKVKGGSSDLKRGTMIRKVHLVGDPDVIECRVDGSTLVLKTIYLKKA